MENIEIIQIIERLPRVAHSFKLIVLKKYRFDGYFNTKLFYKAKWISRSKYDETMKKLEELQNENIKESEELLDYPTQNDLRIVKQVISIVIADYRKNKLTTDFANILVTLFLKEYIDYYITSKDSVIAGTYIHRPNVKINLITSLESYFKLLKDVKNNKDQEIYFRGHSDSNFILLPSLYRNFEWFENERYFYNSITRLCPKDFNGLENHIDRLVEMQHYEMPTRLLDISKSAIVALLFACLDFQNDGEILVFCESKDKIKYGNSDTVTILSCLPSFTYKEQRDILDCIEIYRSKEDEFNKQKIIQRLLHEIKIEKPAFKDCINPEDIQKSMLALPALLNNRIIKQSGAFFITGLVSYNNVKNIADNLNGKRYKNTGVLPIYIVQQSFKRSIKKELELCDLNEATIFPEIDKVSQYLKNNI